VPQATPSKAFRRHRLCSEDLDKASIDYEIRSGLSIEFAAGDNYCFRDAQTAEVIPCMKLLALLSLGCFFCLPLTAKGLADYRVGDIADADVVTPVALDVVDAAATSALQSAKATQHPAIFRSFPETTNVMAGEFLTAFMQARSNFLADVAIEFHSGKLEEATIASADFGRLVTVFGVENKVFPIPDDLAAEWARGGDGHVIRERLLATLEWAAHRPVRPDALPEGMVLGETVRLVPVTEMNQKLSFESLQEGQLISTTNLATLASAQTLFRRDFPAPQQLFARALAAFIQPNCFPDEPFTQLTRGAAIYRLVVSDHYDAGEVIVHRGEAVDAKSLAALAALKERLAANSPAPANAPTASVPAVHAVEPAQPPPKTQVVAAATVVVDSPKPVAARPGIKHLGLILTLAGISLISLIVAVWQFVKGRKPAADPATVAQEPLPFPDTTKPNLTPQVAQAVREAVQQELAAQRRELLLAQQAATDEIAALVQRLDELQVPMQQRLHTYETRIHVLEQELALRIEENRELLKLKIEMISRRLESERAASFVTAMSA
jgi:hypothetical protein